MRLIHFALSHLFERPTNQAINTQADLPIDFAEICLAVCHRKLLLIHELVAFRF